MYSKKHLAIAVIITFFATSILGALGYYWHSLVNLDVLTAAKNLVVENYVDTLTEEQINELNDAALTSMVASLNDPYSYYFDMENYDKFEENNEEEYVGIGLNVEYNAKTNVMTVTSPTPASPAERAGVLPQDIITGVDELTIDKDGYDAIIDYIKGGTEGDVVKLHILRGGEKTDISVKREKIVTMTIFSKMLDTEVGYIKITKFQHNSVKDFEGAIAKLKESGAKGLVIDLRNNPGGYADSVLKMTDMLLPKGTIAYLENNKGEREYFESDAKCVNMPMAVLINEGTASAAELMAGSLQAYDLATIVGKKSYGKAVGQTPIMLTEETAIYLTTARYYTPKGECIDKIGIMPDIEVELTGKLVSKLSEVNAADDSQLHCAVEELYKEITK